VLDLTHQAGLAALAFSLGLRHGLDADHLAAIDSLVRHNLRSAPRRAAACGALFSLGHGAVVMGVACAGVLLQGQALAPAWLSGFGAWVSIVLLSVLGVMNLHAALRPGTQGVQGTVRPVGLKAHVFARLLKAEHPLAIATVGAVFALSFDTVSQALLFSAASAQAGGAANAVALSLLFMLGMLVSDGLNGWWVSRLLGRTDRVAVFTSRLLAALIGVSSLAVAALGLARQQVPALDDWVERHGLLLAAMLVLTLLAAAAVGALLEGRRRLL
jgi:nickel/cobalt transporter (NiCoT) family protein